MCRLTGELELDRVLTFNTVGVLFRREPRGILGSAGCGRRPPRVPRPRGELGDKGAGAGAGWGDNFAPPAGRTGGAVTCGGAAGLTRSTT